MAKFAVILPAAGKSTRLAMKNRKKVFLELQGRAVWLRAAEHFTGRDDVVQTLIVISPEDMEFFKEKYAPNLAFMNIEIVAGGPTAVRQSAMGWLGYELRQTLWPCMTQRGRSWPKWRGLHTA